MSDANDPASASSDEIFRAWSSDTSRRASLASASALPAQLDEAAARAYPEAWLRNPTAFQRLAERPGLGDIAGAALRRRMLEGPDQADDAELHALVMAHPAIAHGLLVPSLPRGATAAYARRCAVLIDAALGDPGFPAQALAPRDDGEAANILRGIRLLASAAPKEPPGATAVLDARAWTLFTPELVAKLGPGALRKASVLLLGSGPHAEDPRSAEDVLAAMPRFATRHPDLVRNCLFAPASSATKARRAHLAHLATILLGCFEDASIPCAVWLPQAKAESTALPLLLDALPDAEMQGPRADALKQAAAK